jgi:hypothetical protein
MSLLDTEIATFERLKPELLEKYAGRYVLIKGDQLIDDFHCFNDALDRGYRTLGRVPFLIERVDYEPGDPRRKTIFVTAR